MVISHHLFLISTPIPCSDDLSSFSIHWIVLDTHTSDDIPNFLMFADVVLPIGTTKFGVDGKSKNFVIPKARESMVGDFSWHLKNENLFGPSGMVVA